MTREQVAIMLFDAMTAKLMEIEPNAEKPDWNEDIPQANKGREVFRAMADAVLTMKGSNDTHGRLVSQ